MAKPAPPTLEKQENKTKQKQEAEYKYIGDDGGRWVFERRSDKRVVTINKPAALPPGNPSQITGLIMVHGFRVNEQVIALCKK